MNKADISIHKAGVWTPALLHFLRIAGIASAG